MLDVLKTSKNISTMRLFKYLSIFVLALLLACSSNDDSSPMMNDDDMGQDPGSAANLITNFAIPAGANNMPIDADVQAGNNTFKVFFPPNVNRSAIVVNYELSPGAQLFIGANEIVSGETPINFTSSVTLTVVAENGDENNYTVTSEGNFTALDAAIENLRTQYNAPGFQLAIVKNEKLVYANHYGNADIAGTQSVTDASLFRIASVSKPVTVIAILKLVQDGVIGLNDTVFGANGILGTDYGTAPYGTNIENIQVIHLIDHVSGWTNNPFDPMFANINWSQEQVIDDIVNNRPLETVPGATYYYSNFGYCVLGRVVEKVTGMSYVDYVKDQILSPSGIVTMQNAKPGTENWPNEVEYYSQENFNPYTDMNVPRMDSHGGWVASATDLAKLLVRVDGGNAVPDILTSQTTAVNYIGVSDWWFAGSLPGTSSVVGKIAGEYNYVILTNTRPSTDIFAIITDMQQLMQSSIENRSSWPNYDLF